MNNFTIDTNAVASAVGKHLDEAKALSAFMAENPEISNEEFEASKKIAGILERHGFAVEYPYCGRKTAFRGVFDNGPGPAVAVMVEYDALPGIGHGCGHNLHGSLAVLAGLALKDLAAAYKGKLYVIGTPAEETDGGKIDMSANGAFDGLDLAMMMHSVGGGRCQADMDALSLRSYTVSFRGRTAHAVAAPWEGRSALAAARKFIDLVDARRECFTPDVHVNAIFTKAGRAVNVIPEEAAVLIEFRTASKAAMDTTDDIILKCAKGAAIALDCQWEWKHNYADFADMIRVGPLEDEVTRIFGELGLPFMPITPPLGSTDAGNTSYHCPTIQPLIAITSEPYVLHTVEIAQATQKPEAFKAMEMGAQTLVRLGLRMFCDADFRLAVQKAWKQSLAAKGA